MGRFASTVEFYSRYREPYPPEFFQKVAEQTALRGECPFEITIKHSRRAANASEMGSWLNLRGRTEGVARQLPYFVTAAKHSGFPSLFAIQEKPTT
jgi:hypothetical protein